MPVVPTASQYLGFDHLLFWVGDAKQAASYFTTRFGFEPVAYSGLETGSRSTLTHVIAHPASGSKVLWAFRSAINPAAASHVSQWVAKHGDGVRDVAIAVTDAEMAYRRAVEAGAEGVMEPKEMKDANGRVVVATIKAYGEVVHSFVQRDGYTGPFLPGFEAAKPDPINLLLPPTSCLAIDHCVHNVPKDVMELQCHNYEKWLGFSRFWSVDDGVVHTKYSSLRSVVMCDPDSAQVTMLVAEPASGKKISQMEEYLIYNCGPGVQHVALRTNSIIDTVMAMRARGVNFLNTPDSYYVDLEERLKRAGMVVKEDPSLQTLRELKILVDFEPGVSYLLQIFTEPQGERPTLFIEIIQRCGHEGFGAGNIKALFESIEKEQLRRGNLVSEEEMRVKD